MDELYSPKLESLAELSPAELAGDSTLVQASRPPVVEIPWLDERKSDGGKSSRDETAEAVSFRPHQVFAWPDREIEQNNGPTVLTRVDRPEAPASARMSRAVEAPRTDRPAAPVEHEPAAQPFNFSVPGVAETATEPKTGLGTILRFDQPESPCHTTKAHEPELQNDGEPVEKLVGWDAQVTAIDHFIRRYHRVIVLAALVSAAGLMLLSVNRPPAPQPAPDQPVSTSAATEAISQAPAEMDEAPPQDFKPDDSKLVGIARGPEAHGRFRHDNSEIKPIEPSQPESSSDRVAVTADDTGESQATYPLLNEDAAGQSPSLPYPSTGAGPLPFSDPSCEPADMATLKPARPIR